MSISNLTNQNTFSNSRGTGYSIGGARKTTLRYDAASGRLVGMAAESDNFTWEYLAGTNLKSKLTYPNTATAEWTYEAERDLIARVKNIVNGNVISQYDYAHDALGNNETADEFKKRIVDDFNKDYVNGLNVALNQLECNVRKAKEALDQCLK